MALTTLEYIDFIAMRPAYLAKNGLFGQLICHMQQVPGGTLRCGWRGQFAAYTFSGESRNLNRQPDRATSSLGIQTYFESKSLARFCCDFLNLQRLAESAFSRFDHPNEAQTRHELHATSLDLFILTTHS